MKSKYFKLKNFIKRNWRALFIFFIIIVDTIAIVVSSCSAYFIRNLIPGLPYISFLEFLLITFNYWIILIFFGLVFGLYRSAFHSSITQQYKIAAKAYGYSVLVIFASFYLLQQADFPRSFVIGFVFLLPIIFVLGRLLIHHFNLKMQKRGYGIQKVLVFSNNENDSNTVKKMQLYTEVGYQVIGFLVNGNKQKELDHKFYNPNSIWHIDSIHDRVKELEIDGIVTTTLHDESDVFLKIMEICKKNNLSLKLMSDESEQLLRFSFIKDIAGIPIYSPRRKRIEKIKCILKRIFDIVGSSFALLILSPVFIFVTIAILIEDGRPILYKQKRALVKGKDEFWFYKFRSMVKDAESKQKELYKFNQTSGGLFRMENDPRITKVGKFIRKYSLDEIPQFYHVFIGEMSLVGPRPLSIADLSNIAPENTLGGNYELRAAAKPGVTGLWQISGRRDVSFKEMVLLDLYYIGNQSVMFDLEILLETIPVVLFGRGAY